MDEFVVKPVERHRLQEAMEAAFSTRGADLKVAAD
jgi:hypothetical protein